jgi:hypothetical protein
MATSQTTIEVDLTSQEVYEALMQVYAPKQDRTRGVSLTFWAEGGAQIQGALVDLKGVTLKFQSYLERVDV